MGWSRAWCVTITVGYLHGVVWFQGDDCWVDEYGLPEVPSRYFYLLYVLALSSVDVRIVLTLEGTREFILELI